MGRKLVLVHVEFDEDGGTMTATLGEDMLRVLGAIEYAKAMAMFKKVSPTLQSVIVPGAMPLPHESGRA